MEKARAKPSEPKRTPSRAKIEYSLSRNTSINPSLWESVQFFHFSIHATTIDDQRETPLDCLPNQDFPADGS